MKKLYVLVIFALVVLNVFLWGVLVINNLNEKNNRLNETTTYKKQPKVKNNGIKKTDSKISKPKVAITFDDGPSTVYTKILLDGLKERGVKATFFLTGQEIQYSKAVVKRMAREGHIIGNHTYSHIDLKKVNYAQGKDEIEKTNNIIKDLTGKKPEYIRPPYGDWDKRLMNETDMSIVLWSVDPEDWKDQNANIVANRVIKSTSDGDVILLHDIFKTSVDAAFIIIDDLREKGYEFVTIDKIDSVKVIKNKNINK